MAAGCAWSVTVRYKVIYRCPLPVFGLTGWAGTFAALDIAAIGCICLMAIVAVMEERKIRREKKIQQLTVA